MCNPILQAKLLNKAGTQLNVVVGLCVGHDSLFYKYSKALATTLVTKDRVLDHNPVGALYQTRAYYKRLLQQPLWDDEGGKKEAVDGMDQNSEDSDGKRRDINGRIDPCTGRHYRSGYHF